MTDRPYLIVSGSFFGLVAVLHLLRVVNSWQFELGPWSFPMWISWFGILLLGGMCVWAFRLARRLA